MRRHIRLAGVAVAAAAALTAAGCSSSSSTTAPPATSAAAAPSASGSSGGLGAQSVTNYLTYTGGKAGPADKSLPPVYIGYVLSLIHI